MQKKYRLKGRKVFNYILNKGKTLPTKTFVLVYSPSKYSSKVGFIVSKKIGKAVVRNKIRRRLRESFRLLIPNVQNNINYIIIARPWIVDLNFNEITKNLKWALTKANLYKNEKDSDWLL